MKPSFFHSIRGRLAGGVALVALVLVAGGAIVGHSITEVMESTNAMNVARDGRIAVAKAVDHIQSMHLNSAEATGHLMAGVVAGAQASGEFGDETLAKAAKSELSDAEDHLANAETAATLLAKTDWETLVPQRDMSKDMSEISASLDMLRQQMDSIAERVRKGDFYTLGQTAIPVIQLAAKLQDDTDRLAKMLSVVQQQHTRSAGEAVETVVRDVNTIALSLIASIVAVFVALVGIYVMTNRQVVGPVVRLAETVHRLARAETVAIPSITSKSEIGMLARSLEQVRNAGMSSARVQTALDNASQPVMLADASHTIIYANQASIDLLRELEPTLRSTIPGFAADAVVGTSMDQFHGAKSEEIRRKVTAMTSPLQHRGEMAGIIIDIKATPIVNGSGERLGTVVEWNDVTSQVHAEEEIARVVDAAASGDFSRSVKEDDKKGYIRNVATSLNTLMMTVTSGLDEIRRGMDALRDGDLTQTIGGEGDFGRIAEAYNETAASLSHALTRINEMAGNVRTAAAEISQGSEDLAKRTESQASSLEQTSATMEELSGTVKNNAANSQQANSKAALAKDAAEKGGIIADRALKAMASIEEASKKIADIINLMEDISFQTNLLALNAAVEAARAGEAGKGFAVVASEVRSLAQRAERAAADVKHHIGESGDRVKEGVALVTQASGALQDIEKMVQETAALIAGIATASREQAIGIEQVTEAVGKMDEAVQQNAALVEQSTAAASSLSIQANDLFETAGSFRLAGAPTTADGKPAGKVQPQAATTPLTATAPAVSGNTALADDWDQF